MGKTEKTAEKERLEYNEKYKRERLSLKPGPKSSKRPPWRTCQRPQQRSLMPRCADLGSLLCAETMLVSSRCQLLQGPSWSEVVLSTTIASGTTPPSSRSRTPMVTSGAATWVSATTGRRLASRLLTR